MVGPSGAELLINGLDQQEVPGGDVRQRPLTGLRVEDVDRIRESTFRPRGPEQSGIWIVRSDV